MDAMRHGGQWQSCGQPGGRSRMLVRMSAERDELRSGVYAPADAARIARITPPRARRWVEGYKFLGRDGSEHFSPALVRCERRGGRLSLTFADLVELLFVRGFLDAGVAWKKVREVHTEASKEFKTSHPFTRRRFEHDGQTIIERAHTSREEMLVDRYTAQTLMRAVMLPLIQRLDYDGLLKQAQRYYPLGRDCPVVIDPRRSFGEATTPSRGVPTRVILAAKMAGSSPQRIAQWYSVSLPEVEAAINFEEQYRRAA